MSDLVERLRAEGNLRVAEKEMIFGDWKTREARIADDVCHKAANEIERLQRELEALRILSFSGNALVQIVEGVQGSMEHGTWRDEKGARLKDTNAWALFYTTFKASVQAAKAKESNR